MPRKDREARLAYQREWYAKNREKVIAKVKHRQRTLYAGVCRNCGGPTVGSTKAKIPEWCAKPECTSVQRQLMYSVFSTAGKGLPSKEMRESRVKWKHHPIAVAWQGRFRIFCSCGWQGDWHENEFNAWMDQNKHTGLRERHRRPDAK